MSTEPWQQIFLLPIQVEVKGHLHGNEARIKELHHDLTQLHCIQT